MPRLPTVSALVFSLVICSGCLSGETPERAYPHLAAATTDGAVDRGWIPPWLPAGATDLHEIHNVDSNQSALSFQTGATRSWRPPPNCMALDAGRVATPVLSLPGWPSSQRLRAGFLIYQCEEQGTVTSNYLAVSDDGRQGYYWRTHRR